MSDQQPDHRERFTDWSAETLKKVRPVMLSCRIPEELRRRLKTVASEKGLQMAQIVEQAILRELDRMEREEA